MTHLDEVFGRWKRRRAQTAVPPDFADRVMRAVAVHDSRRAWPGAAADFLSRLWSSRPARVGICALATLVCVVRIFAVLGVFVARFSVAE